VLQRGDGQEAVRLLDLLEHPDEVAGVVVVCVEDLVHLAQVDRREARRGRVGNGAAGPSERGFLAPLRVRLGGTPVDGEAAPRVGPAHVDALDGAGLRALEARLALERAVLVVEELEPAPVLRRDRRLHLRVPDGRLRLEEAAEGERHPPDEPDAGHEAHACALIG